MRVTLKNHLIHLWVAHQEIVIRSMYHHIWKCLLNQPHPSHKTCRQRPNFTNTAEKSRCPGFRTCIIRNSGMNSRKGATSFPKVGEILTLLYRQNSSIKKSSIISVLFNILSVFRLKTTTTFEGASIVFQGPLIWAPACRIWCIRTENMAIFFKNRDF